MQEFMASIFEDGVHSSSVQGEIELLKKSLSKDFTAISHRLNTLRSEERRVGKECRL